MSVPDSIRVAVVEDHEVFRRGLEACLADDPMLVVTTPAAVEAEHSLGETLQDADVAVVCDAAARLLRFGCPLVVCAADREQPLRPAAGNFVAGVLSRRWLTGTQLHAAVRAAVGLHPEPDPYGRWVERLDARELRVLRLLADGRSTHEIACDMCYSERTIKKHINDLEHRLRARTRAQVVAQAIRQGLI